MIRLRYFLTTMIFVSVLAAVLILLDTGAVPPNIGTQINLPPKARDGPAEPVEIQPDAGALISATIEPDASQLILQQDGQSLLEKHCTRCHVTQGLEQIKKSRPEWEKALAWMEAMGVHLDDSEKDVLLDYLAIDK